MPTRIGKYTLRLDSKPGIIASATAVGSKEGEGPLGGEFDEVLTDGTLGEKTWEKAESECARLALSLALSKAPMAPSEVDLLLAGDLENQCVASCYGLLSFEIPYLGIYGACSNLTEGMAIASMLISGGAARRAAVVTSSHNCAAERQYRNPIEYGGQRPPTAQWTVTGAGGYILGERGKVKIVDCLVGVVQDKGQKDISNMGAAMAPAACSTITAFLQDTKTQPEDLDLILTGDLGYVGSTLLRELMRKQEHIDITTRHNDCGLMLYRLNEQDVNSGGSGCGCSAAVVCSHIVSEMRSGRLNKVLFVGTGALLSAVWPLQGETVPSIAHAVLLTN